MRSLSAALLLMLPILLSACSYQQVYGGLQASQKNECNKLTDQQDRSRCLANASTGYDDYKRQAEAVK